MKTHIVLPGHGKADAVTIHNAKPVLSQDSVLVKKIDENGDLTEDAEVLGRFPKESIYWVSND